MVKGDREIGRLVKGRMGDGRMGEEGIIYSISGV